MMIVCKECGVRFDVAPGKPAHKKQLCHVCDLGIRKRLNDIRKTVGVITENLIATMDNLHKIEYALNTQIPGPDGRWHEIPDRQFTANLQDVKNDLDAEKSTKKKRRTGVMHYQIMDDSDDLRYACNQSVDPAVDKMTRDKNNVNCKNCLRLISNM